MSAVGSATSPNTPPAHELLYDIVDFSCDENTTTSSLATIYNDRRFFITVSEANLRGEPSQIKSQYLQMVSLVAIGDDADSVAEADPMEELCHWIASACLTQFAALAPSETRIRPQTLSDYFNPTTFFLKLVISDGKLTAVEDLENISSLTYLTPRITPSKSLPMDKIPLMHPSDIMISWETSANATARPTKVYVGKVACFFKPSYRGSAMHIEREIQTLSHLHELRLDAATRIPALHGLVQFENSTDISGLLLTYIEHRDTLAGALKSNPPVGVKIRWQRQISTMISQLHNAGIVWGDAKPDNILVDHNDELWLIDFGGGCTPGFVDEPLTETVDGDLQGVSAIVGLMGLSVSRCSII